MSGKVSYNVCFHNLEMGLQTHCYAPMGLNIRGKWTLGGSLPGEPVAPVELGMGAPLEGLYLREDVDMKCNIMMTSFVKKTLKNAHASLVDRLLIKATIADASLSNQCIADTASVTHGRFTRPQASTQPSSTSDYGSDSVIEEGSSGSSNSDHFPTRPSYSMGCHGPEHSDFRDKRIDSYKSLYRRPLGIRSSSSSHNGSTTASENSRPSSQDLTQGTQTGKVSWQSLNAKRSPSIRLVDLAYQNANSYRSSPQSVQSIDHSYHVELPSQERQDSSRQYVRGCQESAPQYFGAVEME